MIPKELFKWTVKIVSLLFVLSLFFSCSSSHPENTLFTRLHSDRTGITFSNNISPSNNFNLFNYRNFYNGGGVALGDINNDGLIDVYFTANQGKNRLYLNKGNFHFEDITKKAGVGGNSRWTTGVTMADVNGDGLLDIYVLNSGDLTGGNRKNELFINQGNLTFKEEAHKFNLDDPAFSIHASFFDYDGDGDLDCYLLDDSFRGSQAYMRELQRKTRNGVDKLGGDKLYRNDDGIFKDVSGKAGIHRGGIGFGLGVSVGDVNGDYRPDIYISNDFWERDYLYINQGDGTFRDELTDRTSKTSRSSMGSDMADVNNDGMLDIFVTDMLPPRNNRIKTMTNFGEFMTVNQDLRTNYRYQDLQNTLQINNGDGSFREMAFLSGVAASDWSWGGLLFDFDNNGWNDIFVSNGVYRDITDKDAHNFIKNRENVAKIVRKRGSFKVQDFLKMLPSQKIKNSAFVNNEDETFTEKSDSLGFHDPSFSNGAAYGDLDNDGDLDLVVNNLNQKAFVYRNNAEKRDHHYLEVEFKGEEKNPFGVGAEVRIYTKQGQKVAENMQARGFQSSVPPQVHFGLGRQTQVDSMLVVWPDGKKQRFKKVKADQKITVKQKDAKGKLITHDRSNNKSLLENVTKKTISGNIKHKENQYIDYDKDPFLPHRLSQEGPKLAKGDVNGDGLIDFFMTGASGQEDKVFIQQADGRFKQVESPDFKKDRNFESTAATFLDIDGDGDLDLMVGSGGNQFNLYSKENTIRVYINNGNGVFKKAPKMAPQKHISASCIVKDDFNHDGRADVFIGARNVPKNYGVDPRSYLLENEGGGQWKDVTPDSLKRPGMVTDATWVDYDNDGDNDLVVVGEWMPVIFYKNDSGSLHYDFPVKQSNGWWSTITQKDLDGDGDADFVLGNWGDNSRFQASEDRPLSMYVGNFNKDQKKDFLITSYLRGEDKAYPFAAYKDMIKEFPFLKEKIPDHKTYAKMTYKKLFSKKVRKKAEKKEVQTLSTSLLINDDGSYELKKLPLEAQLSPVHAIIAQDFNGDSRTDLLLLGNESGLKPNLGTLLGNWGVFLLNKGDLDYRFEPYPKTNTVIKGVVRDALTVDVNNSKHFIIGRNDKDLLIYKSSMAP